MIVQGSQFAKALVLIAALAAVAGCNRDSSLLNLTNEGEGPDEFGVVPTKPLQTPPDLAALPTPTPGAANRTDPTPQADAYAALGGRQATVGRTAAENGLVGYTTRYGVATNIRQELAEADAAFRRENDGRLLERVFDVNIYFDAYEPFELDQRRELERFRSAGVRTPAVPPEPSE